MTTLPIDTLRNKPLVDLIVSPGLRADALLVGAGALLTAFAAQVAVPFQPVPLTLQTLAVLLVGASLGARRGALSMGLYVLVGAAGLPVFSQRSGGTDVLLGATGGYLVGFVLAAWATGFVVERFGSRRLLGSAAAFLAGSVAIYAVGLPWLSAVLDLDARMTVAVGLAPFVLGDVAKLLLAAGLLPVAWRAVARVRRDDER